MPGEIADMMLNGFLDEETGEVIDGTEPGYPRRMADAAPDAVEIFRAEMAGRPPRSPEQLERRKLKRRRQRHRRAAKRLAMREVPVPPAPDA
jgi:hypothetical protein